MSGIYIPSMEMPASCFYCPFRRKVDPDDIMCIVTREVFEETFAGTIETRNRGNCPLVLVPEHGRLIDADALPYTRLYKDNWIKGTGREAPAVWKEGVDSAPTVIPADEEAEK